MLPELGRIGPFVIRTYTLLLDAIIVIGLIALLMRGDREEERGSAWVDVGLAGVVAGLLGARAMHVAIHWYYFSENLTETWQIWRGGLEWHGAVLLAIPTMLGMAALRKVRWRSIAEVFAWLLPLGAIFIYAGCLSTSCGHGREVASLVEMPFPLAAELPDLYGVVRPRLISQLYGLVGSVVLLGISFPLRRLFKREGIRVWLMLGMLALLSFGVAFTRGDSAPPWRGLRHDQALDLLVIGVSIVGAFIASLRPLPIYRLGPAGFERVHEGD